VDTYPTQNEIVSRYDLPEWHKVESLRLRNARELDLLSKTGQPFRLVFNHQILSLLTAIAEKQGALSSLCTAPDFIELRKKQALQTEAYHSSRIEGASASMENARGALTGKPQTFDDESLQMIHNNRLALELACRSRKKRFSKALITEIQSVILNHTHRQNPVRSGDYRKGPVFIVNGAGEKIYEGPPPEQAAAMMKELIRWMNGPPQNHPLIDAALSQLYFLHIHPFDDGNGRTARVLTNLYLMKNSIDCIRLFSLSEHIDRNRPVYYQSIHAVESHDFDATFFVIYFLEAVYRQLSDARILLAKGPLLVNSIKDLLDKETRLRLNRRQTAAIRWLINHDQRLSTRIYCKLNKCADETARKDFRQLIELGIIRSVGAGRSVEYELKSGEITS
jgi:Fic family protein